MYLNIYSYLIFIPMIYISSSMIFFSMSWYSSWMIMEINLISFLSILIFEKKNNSEIPMNYFLIQSFNSYLFIMSSVNLMFYESNLLMYLLINLSILTKMGMPPFYMWMLKMSMNINWNNLFMFMTIQKLIPLIILNNIINLNSFIMKFNMINLMLFSFISSILGLQNLNLKLMMAYSSIIQTSWKIFLLMINEMIFLNFYFIYMMIMYSIINIFKKFNLNYLNNLNNLKFYNLNYYFMIMFSLFSLASIPPSFGFLMKWISIQNMFKFYSFFFILFMIFISLISMYFYLRILFIIIMNFSITSKFNFIMINLNIYHNKFHLSIMWMMIIMLMIYEIY